MGRKRNGKPVHGWLVINKPQGITSTGVVNKAKKILNAAKVGHGGTLDPMATGVLPLAFGEATKTVAHVMDGIKEYRFTVRWGESRDTDDAEGTVTAVSEKRPERDEIVSVLDQFIGEVRQVPPNYSAVKVEGRRAYDLARSNQPMQLDARTISINKFELLEMPDQDHAVFRVVAGKGAYMRALARDIALALRTQGHVSQLRRTRLGPFGEEDAISLDKLVELRHTASAKDILRPVEIALDDIPALTLTATEARRLKCGLSVSVVEAARRIPLNDLAQGETVFAMAEGKPVALARLEGGNIRPYRVLNL